MRGTLGLVGLALLTAGCLASSGGDPGPIRAVDFRPEQVRRPIFVVGFRFGSGFEAEEQRSQRFAYEGALLDTLNARAVLAREVRVLPERDPLLDPAAALRRGRDLGADHVVRVEVRVVRPVQSVFCSDTRRPFRVSTTLWSQAVSVVRVRDGATRLRVPPTGGGLDVQDFVADCEHPRESTRRPPAEALDEAAMRLLNRVVGP